MPLPIKKRKRPVSVAIYPWPDDRFDQVPPHTAAVPSSAVRFVSPTGTNSGAGPITAPWLTIAYAITNCTAGDTIIVRGGLYREGAISIGKLLTLQSYPGEQVWMRGDTIVSGWVSDTGRYRKDSWTALALRGGSPVGGNMEDPQTVDSNFPMAGYPDQVWIDDVPQTQVATLAACTAGSSNFYVNYGTQQVYIGTDPTGRTVELNTRFSCFNVEGAPSGVVFRGIGFRRYQTYFDSSAVNEGAVRGNSAGITLESCSFVENSGTGLILYGANSIVRYCKFAYNGKNGAGGFGPNNLLFEKNRLWQNNQQNFAVYWDVCGVKWTFTNVSISRDNYFHDNNCGGFWLDISCKDSTVTRNHFYNNVGWGISPEESVNTTITSNWVEGTRQFATNTLSGVGIYCFESNVGIIANNTLINNEYSLLLADGNRNPDANANSVGATWALTGWSIYNNVIVGKNSGARSNVNVTNYGQTSALASAMITSLDYNTYLQPPSPGSVQFQWQTSAGASTNYATLATFVAANGAYEANGVSATAANNPLTYGESPSLNGTTPAAGAITAINSGLATPIYSSGSIGRGVLHIRYTVPHVP